MLIKKYILAGIFSIGAIAGTLHLVSHGWLAVERRVMETYYSSKLYKYVTLIESEGDVSEPTIDQIIKEASSKFNVPEPLIHGLVSAESTRNSDAYSPVGAIGLMQIMPFNATRCNQPKKSKLWDERINIFCGTQIFREELDEYQGDVKKAIMSYNGGPKCVKALCPESVRHVEKVISAAADYLIKTTS